MKTFSRLIVGIALALSVNARADFTGYWQGTGTSEDTAQSWQSDCDPIILELNHSSDRLDIVSGYYKCGDREMGWEDFSIAINNGELWVGDTYLGTITDDQIAIAIGDPATQLFEINAVINQNGELIYNHRITSPDGVQSLEGTLTR